MLTTYWKASLHHSRSFFPHWFHISCSRTSSQQGTKSGQYMISECWFWICSQKILSKCFPLQCVLHGCGVGDSGNISLWLRGQAGGQPKQSVKERVDERWGESGAEQRDKTSRRTQKRRGGVERGKTEWYKVGLTGWATAVQCWAETLWEPITLSSLAWKASR